MKLTSRQIEKLLKGNQTFSNSCFSMMLSRLREMYAQNPSTAVVQTAANEINTFLDKFKILMENDLSIISKL